MTNKLSALGCEEVATSLRDPESELRAGFVMLDEALLDLYKHQELTPITELEALFSQLQPAQRELLEAINALDPRDYGISAPPHEGIEPVPETVEIEFISATDTDDKGNPEKSMQRVPVHVYEEFQKMDEAFQKEHPERKLKIVSGYRSPAFQLYTFVRFLVHVNDFDIVKNFQRVMLPAFSQHCKAIETALDIANVDGKPSLDKPHDFEETIECKWLRAHAHKFGFFESYPPDNEYGIMPESWHWQYKGARSHPTD